MIALATLLAACLEVNAPGLDGGLSCDPPCGQDLVCDPATATCVRALVEGQPCSGVGGLCVPPLVCGATNSRESRCSTECTVRSESEVCGPNRKCFARPGASGAFCVTPATEDGLCDETQLALCVGTDLVCIARSAADPAGRCFRRCDPAADNCEGGKSCADPWAPADPTRGICVDRPVDGRCDYASLRYCGRGEICARGSGVQPGWCHTRCAPDTVGTCAAGMDCIAPWRDLPATGICVTPQPTGAGCDAAADRYCGLGDICVWFQLRGVSECARDCTSDPTRCAPLGKTCQKLGDNQRFACL